MSEEKIPKHIAIIMDGNRRWAKSRGLSLYAGYRAGVRSLRRVVKNCVKLKVPVLTVYAFSTENWQRPADEVKFLMTLLETILVKEITELHANGVNVRVLGNKERLSKHLLEQINQAEQMTVENDRLKLNVAWNYGGRQEIVRAAKRIAKLIEENKITSDQVDEELFVQHLYTNGIEDPDLIIRTGGECRISNFLLWQLAYSEICVTPTYWPDFSEEDLKKAISDYQDRDRRFGRV